MGAVVSARVRRYTAKKENGHAEQPALAVLAALSAALAKGHGARMRREGHFIHGLSVSTEYGPFEA